MVCVTTPFIAGTSDLIFQDCYVTLGSVQRNACVYMHLFFKRPRDDVIKLSAPTGFTLPSWRHMGSGGGACGPELRRCGAQLLSAADRLSWLIFTEGAKTICRGVKRGNRSLFISRPPTRLLHERRWMSWKLLIHTAGRIRPIGCSK